MKIKQRIFDWWTNLRIKAFYTIVASGTAGWAQSKQFDYKTAADEGFKQVVWVYRCIMEIANRVSSVPWGVYRKDKNGEDELIQGHPLGSLLLFPNSEQSWKEFLEWWVIYLFVSGNDYVEKGEKPKPDELWHLRPDRIQIVPSKDPNIRIDYYQYTVDGTVYKIPAEEIVHYKFPDPTNDWYGLSPLYVMGRNIDTENYSTDWNKNMFRNQARPYGFLQTDAELNDDSFNRLKLEIRENWQGTSNAFKPGILEKGLKYIQAQLSPREADYLGLKRLTREEICGGLGVPPMIAGIMENATLANFEQAEKTFWHQTIIPTLRKFRDRFNHSIAKGFGDGIFIDYNLKHIQALQESEESLFKRAQEGFRGGFLTQNQARSLVGEEADPSGDFFIMPASFIQIPAGAKSKRLLPNLSMKANVLNLFSDSAKSEYLDTIETRREKWIEKAKKQIAKILSDRYKFIASKVAGAERNEINNVLNIDHLAFEEKVTSFYAKIYSGAIKEFGQAAIDDIYSSLKSRGGSIETKADVQKFDSLESAVFNWIQNITGERIKEVSETTINDVKGIVSSGISQGLTITEISDSILSLGEITSLVRADRIAITEIVSCSNAGSYFGVKQLPFASKVKKVWLTSFVNSRESHIAANNQKVGMDEPFHLSDGSLMFPGDSSLGAPAKTTINCRCTQSYDTTEAGGLVGAGTTLEELEAGL